MNKRQWLTLAFGVVAAGSVLVLGTKRLNPPVIGPTVEYAHGLSSVTMTDAVTPPWALLTSFAVLALTRVLVCRSRKTPKG